MMSAWRPKLIIIANTINMSNLEKQNIFLAPCLAFNNLRGPLLEGTLMPEGSATAEKSVRDFEFTERFQDFSKDFRFQPIQQKISRFQQRFQISATAIRVHCQPLPSPLSLVAL